MQFGGKIGVNISSISMPEGLEGFVDEHVKGRCDANPRLEELHLEGLDSGAEVELTSAFWEELKSEADQRIAERRRKSSVS